jgi:hypothetical protein
MDLKTNRKAGIGSGSPSSPARARAIRFHRSLRGGAQAKLLEADDGRFYVTKFRDNPQERRVLINEWLCTGILRYLGLATPAAAIVEVGADLIAREPGLHMQLAHGRRAVKPGPQFGSAYPGHPDSQAVYDFLPDKLLRQVANVDDFLGAFVVDKWTAGADARQAIFFSGRLRDWIPGAEGSQKGYVMQLVDHGFAFDGARWEYMDSPLQGLYARKLVYDEVTGLESFEPWLTRVETFPAAALQRAFREIPPEWLAGDEDAACRLIEILLERRARVAHLIEAGARGSKRPFPNWGKRLHSPRPCGDAPARPPALVMPILAH